jgi:phosphatidylglycerol---prolipoprotein diacylglyceryl transferase
LDHSVGNFSFLAFSVGSLSVTWYGLLHTLGILIGWAWGRSWAAKSLFAMGGTDSWPPVVRYDLWVLLVLLSIVLGARLAHIVIYEWRYYSAYPSEAMKLWHGGLSFHGGAVAALIVTVAYSRICRIPLLGLFDVLALLSTINVTLGRLANFINGELWGRPTSVAWGVVFDRADALPRHPSQLYEMALEGLVPLAVGTVLLGRGYLARRGMIAGVVAVLYSAARFVCEFFREPEGYWAGGALTLGQALSLPLLFFGIALIAIARRSPAE